MAKKATIGGRIALDGEKEYRQAIANVNASLKTLASESKLVAAQFKGQENSTEALGKKNEVLGKQYEETKRKLQIYEEALKNSDSNLKKCSQNVDGWKDKLGNAQKELERLKNSSNASNEEIEQQEEAVEKAKKSLESAEKQYNAAINNNEKWKTSINNTQTQLYELNDKMEDNEKQLESAKDKTNKTADSVDNLGDKVEDTKNKTSVFGDVLKANLATEAIVAGVKRLGEAIAGIGSKMVQTGMEFQSSMSQVAATMGMTSEEMNGQNKEYEALEEAAKECGETTKYSASEAAEGLNYLALAGYDATKAVETLPKVLTLASAGGMELADTSDMVTDAMSALRLGTEDLNKFVDQLAKTSQKSNTNVAMLGEGILTVGGTANNLKGGITELNTELGILADNGIKGAEGGTHLRNIILAMNPTTDKAVGAFEKLNVTAYDSQGSMKGLNVVFNELGTAMEDMTQQERQEVLTNIFNKTDLKAVEALLANCGDRFDELSGQIENSNGAAQAMSQTMENNLKGDLTVLGSATEGLQITIEETFDKTMRSATQKASASISDLNKRIKTGDLEEPFNKLADAVGSAMEGLIDLGTDAIPVIADGFVFLVDHGDQAITCLEGIAAAMITYKAVSGIMSVVQAFQTLRTATEAAETAQVALNTAQSLNPYALLAAGIAALGVGIYNYVKNVTDSSTATNEFTQGIIDMGEELDRINEDIQNNKKNYDESVKSTEAQYEANRMLADQLTELDEKENKSNAEKQRMQALVDELNQSIPNLNLTIDEQTGKLNMQRQALNDVIASMKEQALQEVQINALKEKATTLAEAQLAQQEALDTYTQSQNAFNDAQQRYNELKNEEAGMAEASLEDWQAWNAEMVNAEVDCTNLTLSMEMAKEKLDEANGTVSQAEGDYNKLDGTISNMNSTLEESTQKTGEVSGAYDSMSEEISSSLEEMQKSYSEQREETEKTIRSQIGLFDEFKKSGSKSTKELAKELKKNLSDQVTGIKEWQENISKLSGTLSEDLVKELATMGPDAAAEIKALASMSDDELKEYQKVWEEKNEAVAHASTAGLEGMKNDMLKLENQIVKEMEGQKGEWSDAGNILGSSIGAGILFGISSKEGQVTQKMKTLSKNALEASKKELDINSPSKKARKLFQYVPEGAALGLEDGSKKIEASARRMANSALYGNQSTSVQTTQTKLSINYGKLGDAVAKSITGLAIECDSTQFGQLIDRRIRRGYA